MQKEFSEEKVYSDIKSGFGSFKVLAKASLAKRWKDLSRSQKYDAGRALVKIADVAKYPEIYFSRAATEKDYMNRIKNWIEKNNVAPENAKYAFYMVWRPSDYVVKDAANAFWYNAELRRDFYNFCDLVHDWEYGRTADDEKGRNSFVLWAKKIEEEAKDLKKRAEIKHASLFLRPIKEFLYSFQK